MTTSERTFDDSYSMHSIDFDSSEFTITDEDITDCDLRHSDEREVSFGSVEIREYPVTIDDHPTFRDSCPLTLTWNHVRTMKSTVEEFDKNQEKRQSSCSRLSLRERRKRVARTQGISFKEVEALEMKIQMNCYNTDLAQSSTSLTKNCRKPSRTLSRELTVLVQADSLRQ